MDPELLPGSESGSGIIVPDPDPAKYDERAIEIVDRFFFMIEFKVVLFAISEYT